MVSWKRILVPVAAAMGLFACDRADPVSHGPDAATGSARVALPALPSGYLAAGATARLRLDITGQGMTPIYFEQTLSEGKPTTLDMEGIPPGLRIFHGVLMRIDSTGWDSSITHEGSVSAEIQATATANVALFLKSTGTGSAHVCLQVEGWPLDSTCVKPPPPVFPSYAGCYALTVTKHGPRHDTLFQAKLRILQSDSSLFAVTTWNSGAKDSAEGIVTPFGFNIGPRAAQFQFTGHSDSSTVGGLLGYFQDSARGIYGNAVAVPAPCDTAVAPPPSLDTVICWGIEQTTLDGRQMKGSLWTGWRGASMHAWFQWNGSPAYAFAMDNGTVPVGGTAALYFFGTLPGGFAHPTRNVLEMGHYKTIVAADGTLTYGAAYARFGSTDYTTADKFADWTGAPMVCPEPARAQVASLFP
jgi:hypothetical protein